MVNGFKPCILDALNIYKSLYIIEFIVLSVAEVTLLCENELHRNWREF